MSLEAPSNTALSSWVLTNNIGASPAHLERVLDMATSLGLPSFSRREQTLAKISRLHEGLPVASWHETQGWIIRSPGGDVWRWHPGLAHIRVAAAEAGQPDRLVRALAPLEGKRVLDANLGLGRDALVIAASGAREVVGLEIDPILCDLTRLGLKGLKGQTRLKALEEATPKIRCICACQREYLKRCTTDEFDAVYFSPMFITPTFASSDMTGLRQVAAQSWPGAETIAEALRVAPKVVIKLEYGRHPPLPKADEVFRKRNARLEFAVYLRKSAEIS